MIFSNIHPIGTIRELVRVNRYAQLFEMFCYFAKSSVRWDMNFCHDCQVIVSLMSGAHNVFQNLMQRYDEHFTFSKFLRNFFT